MTSQATCTCAVASLREEAEQELARPGIEQHVVMGDEKGRRGWLTRRSRWASQAAVDRLWEGR